jgi:polyvinyl alcohol dehydrogenase (cytochrome)
MNLAISKYRFMLIGMILMLVTALTAQENSQWLMAGQNRNNTRNAATESKISPSNVSQLAVKWAFTTAGDVSATPAVDGNAVYFPDWGGYIYKLNAKTGAKIWSRQISEFTGQNFNISRVTPLIEGNQVIFGTQLGDPAGAGATVISLNKNTGALLWQTQIDNHFASIVTQSAVAHGNTIYVGVASMEELFDGLDPNYELSFRGSLVALDKNTGAIKWKTYMTPGEGFTGCAIWGSTPVIDPKRGSVYVTTGNNYGVPQELLDEVAAGQAAGETPEQIRARVMSIPGSSDNHFDAVVAMDLQTGAIKWANSVIPFDAWTTACFFLPEECSDPAGPDYDFGQGPALFTTKIGKKKVELLGAGQKSGVYWALNPDNGEIVWSTQANPGGVMGGLQWGSAVDDERIYTAASNSYYIPHVMGPGPRAGETIIGGFWTALDAATGAVVWENAGIEPAFPTLLGPPPPGAIAMNQGPVTVANGVMYAGALDQAGTMYALDAASGEILWQFASGGSVNSGAAVVNGVVYWGSGYTSLGGTQGTNLYAFSLPSLHKVDAEDADEVQLETPEQFELEANYPNPFNPETTIRFALAEDASVRLIVYNSAGQLIKTLTSGEYAAGSYSFKWDATDQNGVKVPSGIYLYRLEANNFVKSSKMILVK